MNGIETYEKSIHEEFKSKKLLIVFSKICFLFSLMIVTDAMQRESAIADDYWRYTFKHGKKDQVEVALQNIERK
jgi:hypothetical protein